MQKKKTAEMPELSANDFRATLSWASMERLETNEKI